MLSIRISLTDMKGVFLIAVVVVAGVAGGITYTRFAYTNPTISNPGPSFIGCQAFPPDQQPNLFGNEIYSVQTVTLPWANYTAAQWSEARQVALNQSVVKQLIQNRTLVDYTTFQKIQSGQVSLSGRFYTVTSGVLLKNATEPVQNMTSNLRTFAGYRLCDKVLYRVLQPEGMGITIWLHPSLSTVSNQFEGSEQPVTITTYSVVVDPNNWNVIGYGSSPQ